MLRRTDIFFSISHLHRLAMSVDSKCVIALKSFCILHISFQVSNSSPNVSSYSSSNSSSEKNISSSLISVSLISLLLYFVICSKLTTIFANLFTTVSEFGFSIYLSVIIVDVSHVLRSSGLLSETISISSSSDSTVQTSADTIFSWSLSKLFLSSSYCSISFNAFCSNSSINLSSNDIFSKM